jgi:hypothetical protein
MSSPQPPRACTSLLVGATLSLFAATPLWAQDPQKPKPQAPATGQTLEEMRLAMGKWIETQQIVAKERKDWQQGKEILTSRIDLVKKEIALLEQKIAEAQASADKAQKKKDELLTANESHKTSNAQLTAAVTTMEADIKKLWHTLPEPVQANAQKLFQRIPADAATTRISAAERYQNVLGILDIANKANNEITVNYEIRTLAGGKKSEVQAIYVGLGVAYYVSADGDAGIGHPTPTGWRWEPSAAVSRDLVMALDIMKGKHTAAFVPLPVVLQ